MTLLSEKCHGGSYYNYCRNDDFKQNFVIAPQLFYTSVL